MENRPSTVRERPDVSHRHPIRPRGTMRFARRWSSPAACVALVLVVMTGTECAAAQPSVKDVLGQGSEADESGDAKPEEAPTPGVVDDLKRGTPRSTVGAYLGAAREGEYETAAQYLDLRHLPKDQIDIEGPRLARQLKLVLDRELWIDLYGLSKEPGGFGKESDGLPSYRELVGRIKGKDRAYDILLQRVPRGDDVSIWKFASVTVAEVPYLYTEFGFGRFGEWLPPAFYEYELLGFELVHWLTLLVCPPVCYLLAALTTGVIVFLLRRRKTTLTIRLAQLVAGPFRLFLTVVLFSAVRRGARLPLTLNAFVAAVEDTLLVVALAWTVLRVADVVWQVLFDRLVARRQTAALGVLPASRTTMRVLIIFVALLAVLRSFGVNVTAVVAGLGVGGIAIALAAQRTFENLIGGITLFADQPVRVGEFCRFGDVVGTVEQIGLRSTRIRTLDRTLMSVPNSEFSNMHLDNFTKRDKIWFHPRIALRYETTPDQLRYVLVEIRKMLYAHPKIDSDPARVRFVQFGAYSLDIDIFAYVTETDYSRYLEVAEDLNLRIMDIVARAGSSFAFPSQTTYLENGSALDSAHAQDVESEVTKWRMQRAMYLPAFPQEEIDKLRGTLDYPPKGSPEGEAFEEPGRTGPAADKG